MPKGRMKIATWNVRTMLRCGELETIKRDSDVRTKNKIMPK